MIKILYDYQAFDFQKFGGISRYVAELINGLRGSKEISSTPGFFFSENKHVRQKKLTKFKGFTDKINFRGKKRLKDYLKQRESDAIIRKLQKSNFNIFHPTYYHPYFLEFLSTKKPFVLTVHDMIHEIYYDHNKPSLTDETKYKRLLIPKATRIIAVSQQTKSDIMRFFPEVPESKIDVIYHGSSFKDLDLKEKEAPSLKYILFVGHRSEYKNFNWFVNSVAAYMIEKKITLICAGSSPFTTEEQSLFAKLHFTSNVQYVPIDNDHELIRLYRNASCFVFPSLYEGFGIPILEAFSCQCPVILSNTSCFPEIAGNAALYFDKDDAESLVTQISKVLDNEYLAQTLRESGVNRNKLYSWDRMVEQHIAIYQSIVANT